MSPCVMFCALFNSSYACSDHSILTLFHLRRRPLALLTPLLILSTLTMLNVALQRSSPPFGSVFRYSQRYQLVSSQVGRMLE